MSESTQALPHGMALALFGGHKDHVAHQLRARADYRHVTFQDVEEFGEFVKACAAQELAVSVQANIIGEQFSVCILLVCHGTEFDELENFFIFAGARLGKERISLHLVGANNREQNKQRAQTADCRQSTKKV